MSTRAIIKLIPVFLLTFALLFVFVANSFSSAESIAEILLIDATTFGYYNNKLGTILDGTQLQFPPANHRGGDPTIVPAPEPNLASATSILGNWLSPAPVPLNTNWSGLQNIPNSWAVNSETAIIYPIDAGSQGITRLTGNFGVDNGIFVWVNGEYRFGAIEPGPVGGFEYRDIDLGSLPPGTSYIQVLREDHGGITGFKISVTGTVESVSGHITSPMENITIGPAKLMFSANAWANNGNSVKQVKFLVFYDGRWHSAGIDSTSPYEVVWQTPNLLRSQQLKFGIHVLDSSDKIIEFADVVYDVNYLESLGNPDVNENWIPTRAYLNQRSLEPNGDSKCSVASMAMVLAMNSIIDWDYTTLRNKANEMYPKVIDSHDNNVYMNLMVSELQQQGMQAELKTYSVDKAWLTIKQQIDIGHPVIVSTVHGIVTSAGHFIVAVGYRETTGSRQIIAYDPFGKWKGTCCTNNYDFNSREPSSRKGQWVLYDFDLIFGLSRQLITGYPTVDKISQAAKIPSTKPDLLSDEPENIDTYLGVHIQTQEKVFLPVVSHSEK